MRKLLILIALLACVGCGAHKFRHGPPLTQAQKDYYISRYWADAQEMLEDKTNGASVAVPSAAFEWNWTRRLIVYKGEFAYGLFTRLPDGGGYIWVVEFRPWTIRHEACHAILSHLGYLDWNSYCHEGSEWR
jgi:hypothetical protein